MQHLNKPKFLAMLRNIVCCAGSLPDRVQQGALPAVPEGPEPVPAPDVLLGGVVLHRGSHHHPRLQRHPPGHHLGRRLPHRGLLVGSRYNTPFPLASTS